MKIFLNSVFLLLCMCLNTLAEDVAPKALICKVFMNHLPPNGLITSEEDIRKDLFEFRFGFFGHSNGLQNQRAINSGSGFFWTSQDVENSSTDAIQRINEILVADLTSPGIEIHKLDHRDIIEVALKEIKARVSFESAIVFGELRKSNPRISWGGSHIFADIIDAIFINRTLFKPVTQIGDQQEGLIKHLNLIDSAIRTNNYSFQTMFSGDFQITNSFGDKLRGSDITFSELAHVIHPYSNRRNPLENHVTSIIRKMELKDGKMRQMSYDSLFFFDPNTKNPIWLVVYRNKKANKFIY